MATFVAQEEISSRRILAILLFKTGIFVNDILLTVAIFVTLVFFLCRQVDVAFLRAARAGNLEKVRTFLTEEGDVDIHTCSVSDNILFDVKYI